MAVKKAAKKSARSGAKKSAVKKPAAPKVAAPAKRPAAKGKPPAALKKKDTQHMPPASQASSKALTKSQKEYMKATLIALKERLTGQVTALKVDSLQREDGVNSAEDGTDAFERQFALTIASAENHDLVEIEEALQRLEDGSYGVCEECQCLIESNRLRALPFVRKCVACQSRTESGRMKSRALALLDGL
jgi:DnaK suppressor protein